jgi:aminopeptidase-like protein
VACYTGDAGRKACDSSNKAINFVRFGAKVESVINLVELTNFSHRILNQHVGNTTIKDSWVAQQQLLLIFLIV